MMRLDELLRGLPDLVIDGRVEVDVTSATLDSRRVQRGALFAALSGAHLDGRRFIGSAVDAGAVAVLGSGGRPADLAANVPWIEARQTRAALAAIAKRLAQAPDEQLQVVGITGTKGKTTTTQLLAAALDSAGVPAATGGTLGQRFGDWYVDPGLTTPEAPELWSFLAIAQRAGARAAVLEVSSSALVADRVSGMTFAAAVLTGIGHDHLDQHGDARAYRAAKRRLFEQLPATGVAILPQDEPFLAEFAAVVRGPRLTFGTDRQADWCVIDHQPAQGGARFTLRGPQFERSVAWSRPGVWDALNAAAALATAQALGADPDGALHGIATVTTIPGRFERIDVGQPFLAIVDYAHTPESLERTLQLLRQITSGRVIVVFGCGGERDRDKRPVMGRVAASLADHLIVTDDNPRGEDPQAIAQAILAGTAGSAASCEVVAPRRAAIERAISLAAAGDAVLIAGKGHETYQEIGGRRFPFDDRQVLRSALERGGSR